MKKPDKTLGVEMRGKANCDGDAPMRLLSAALFNAAKMLSLAQPPSDVEITEDKIENAASFLRNKSKKRKRICVNDHFSMRFIPHEKN